MFFLQNLTRSEDAIASINKMKPTSFIEGEYESSLIVLVEGSYTDIINWYLQFDGRGAKIYSIKRFSLSTGLS